MTVSPLQRSLFEQELREIYNTYMRQKDAIEAEVKARVEREIASERGNMLVKLSETMHDYHRKGLPIAGIRRATRKYNNTDAFNELWLAYTPEEDFSLSPGRHVILPYEWDEYERNVLWWKRDKAGKDLPEPIRVEIVNESKPLAPEISYAHRMILKEHLGNLNTFLNDVAGPIILERFPKED